MVKIPGSVQAVLRRFAQAGYEAWCVGGCVRDSLLGRVPEDWDVTTNALPEETMALFPTSSVPTGLQHGTVTVRSEGESIEVTTYRVDGTYQDHRRPESVTFTRSLEEDLRRRDFTMNAMALGLDGTLRDPFGGEEDLKRGLLRCVGTPQERLEEDALRILRGLRFAAVLDCSIEEETAAAIHQTRDLLAAIAPERIWIECKKLLCGKSAAAVLRNFPDVAGVVVPELLPMVGFQHQNHHHCFDVWEHTLHALDAVEPNLILRCTLLFHDIGKPDCFTVDERGIGHFYGHPARSAVLADGILRRLRCDHDTRRTIVRLIEWHDRNIPRTREGILSALRKLGEENLRSLIAVKRADNLAQASCCRGNQKEIDRAEELLDQLLLEGACFSLRQLAVNGRELLDAGIPPGPEVGAVLEWLLDQVISGKLPNETQALRSAARHWIASEPGDKEKGVSLSKAR